MILNFRIGKFYNFTLQNAKSEILYCALKCLVLNLIYVLKVA